MISLSTLLTVTIFGNESFDFISQSIIPQWFWWPNPRIYFRNNKMKKKKDEKPQFSDESEIYGTDC